MKSLNNPEKLHLLRKITMFLANEKNYDDRGMIGWGGMQRVMIEGTHTERSWWSGRSPQHYARVAMAIIDDTPLTCWDISEIKRDGTVGNPDPRMPELFGEYLDQ